MAMDSSSPILPSSNTNVYANATDFTWNTITTTDGIMATASPSQHDFEALEDSFNEFKDEISERLDDLEEQVVLVQRDTVLEKDFEELKEAWQAYNDLLDKLKTFKALRDSA